jgi:hypothetical protein
MSELDGFEVLRRTQEVLERGKGDIYFSTNSK